MVVIATVAKHATNGLRLITGEKIHHFGFRILTAFPSVSLAMNMGSPANKFMCVCLVN